MVMEVKKTGRPRCADRRSSKKAEGYKIVAANLIADHARDCPTTATTGNASKSDEGHKIMAAMC
jgi:hypothetical protein